MSGGSLNYVYSRVQDAATEVAGKAETPLHRAFAVHLMKVSQALHDLEWVWSADYGEGREVAAIEACLTPGATLEAATVRAQDAMRELQLELEKSR